MLLQCTETRPLHPAGIFLAVCVDVIDQGLRVVIYNGKERLVHQVRTVFETQVPGSPPQYLARTFTASLNQNARLNEFLSQWRGRPIVPGDSVDLDKLVGVPATLVVSHQPRRDGNGTYAAIDAVSRATKQVVPSGTYDSAAAHAWAEEENARLSGARHNPSPLPPVSAQRPIAQMPATDPEIDDVPF